MSNAMNRDAAKQEIVSRWRELIPEITSPAKDRVNGEKSYICPICGHGTHGDGLTVNPKSKAHGLKCFGSCGFSGNILDLYMESTGADFATAMQWGADQLGIDLAPLQGSAANDFRPQYDINNLTLDDKKDLYRQSAEIKRKEAAADQATPAAPKTPQNGAGTPAEVSEGKISGDPQQSAGNATEAAKNEGVADYTAYYEKCALRICRDKDPAAISYLKGRGLYADVAACVFNVGYDPEWISPTAVKKLRTQGNNWTPPATRRIIIPISKNHYIARAIDPEVEKKYQKQNETGGGAAGIFNAAALYPYPHPDGSTINPECVFITEGAFDALAIMDATEYDADAIALNSTSNADLLLKQLEERPTKATLILCLDDDDAGKKARDTLRDGLTRLNIPFITADICCGYKDPNDALVADREAFTAAINKAIEQTAARPDNTADYIDNLMGDDIARFKDDIKTGFTNLDLRSGGLYSGLYVLAAISSLGKTSFALQLADQLAAAGKDILFFSLEQSRLELVTKSLARITAQSDFSTAVTSLSIRKGFIPKQVTEAAQKYKEKVGNRISIIEGNFACNISFIGDYIRQYIRCNNTRPVIIIDYLQILQPEENQKATTKEIVDTTITELKRISRNMGVTVLAISSVNRANYLTPIDFESLKESGSIEYTADVIWGLQLQCLSEDKAFAADRNLKEKRDIVREAKGATPRKVQLVCLKNRYGISNYDCKFDYYPANDLFIEGDDFIKLDSKPQQVQRR